ncbi:hypothetical protein TWF481_002385 [Arthrobotrys musiformis]|uniref:Uncharacterized protein n=1 Tax=Arthrobotrys musiformis TaxID=47236 RepID=A0AAV9VZ43_9PEZI
MLEVEVEVQRAQVTVRDVELEAQRGQVNVRDVELEVRRTQVTVRDVEIEHARVRSEYWVLKVAKSRVGAIWFCFANFVSFIFILLVFLGNIYPSTTMFAMISIDLHPQFNNTLSFEIYRADNYTGTNPLTNRTEQPRYLYLGFSGHCNIYDNNSTHFNQYSKECTKSFVQPLLLPNGTLQNGAGKIRDTATHNVNFEQVYQMWKASAAFMILVMIYNVAGIAVVCAGKYEFVFKYFWIVAILLSIPPAVLAPVALSKVYSPLNGAQIPRWGVAFNKTGAGQCLGLGFFLLAMLLTFIGHPILFIVAIVIVGFSVAIVWWAFSCCSGGKPKEEDEEGNNSERGRREAEERRWKEERRRRKKGEEGSIMQF